MDASASAADLAPDRIDAWHAHDLEHVLALAAPGDLVAAAIVRDGLIAERRVHHACEPA